MNVPLSLWILCPKVFGVIVKIMAPYELLTTLSDFTENLLPILLLTLILSILEALDDSLISSFC